MQRLVIIFIGLLLVSSCNSQESPVTIANPIVLKAKEVSLYAPQVNWEEVDKKFTELTKDKQEVEDLKEGLQYLINSLGDKHGTFRSAKDGSIVVSYTGERSGRDNRDADFVRNVINDVSSKFSYQLLDDGIGYLKIVGIAPGNIQEEANLIGNGLKELKKQGATKWIVDLRFNGGGDMNPMIAGLAPLIGDGFIGGSVDNQNSLIREYKIEQGQFYDTGNLVAEIDGLPTIQPNEKVAVLLSRYTISSGELVAVAFKGKKNTRFIGEATAGYTTGNGWEPVTEELIMNISQGVFVDRNKARYDNKVEVDETIEFQHLVEMEEDRQMSRAMEWLNEE